MIALPVANGIMSPRFIATDGGKELYAHTAALTGKSLFLFPIQSCRVNCASPFDMFHNLRTQYFAMIQMLRCTQSTKGWARDFMFGVRRMKLDWEQL